MEQQFCYTCRVHHDVSVMKRYLTRMGYRWRCLKSIEAAQRSQAARDAFGRSQTEVNREFDQRYAFGGPLAKLLHPSV